MVARVCPQPGCPQLAPCPQHTPPVGWTTRPSPRNQSRPGNARALRDRIRRRDRGICYWCGQPGAHHVDHIQAIADGGTWDESNLAVMHSDCHADKTARERAARTST